MIFPVYYLGAPISRGTNFSNLKMCFLVTLTVPPTCIEQLWNFTGLSKKLENNHRPCIACYLRAGIFLEPEKLYYIGDSHASEQQ